MKTTILVSSLVMLTAGVLAQGTVFFHNSSGPALSLSPTASANGAFFIVQGGATILLNDATGIYHGSLFGGPSPTSLVPLVQDTLMDWVGPGSYFDDTGNGYVLRGVSAGSPGFLQVEMWQGNAPSYAAALAAGAYAGQSPVFSNETGGSGLPPTLPWELSGMPAVIFAIPEPGVLVLGFLGAAALFGGRQARTSPT